MEAIGGILLSLLLFLPTLLSYIFMRKHKRKPQKMAQLPPGSMGWPYVGETLQLYYQDPKVFFTTKQQRYGEIFKTSILGCPCIMMASPEAARFVLVTHAHLFKPTYPRSKEQMIGPSALFFHQGDYHTRLRKLVQGSLSPNALRNLVPDIQAIAISTLQSWGGGRLINTFHEMKEFSFNSGILIVFGHLDTYCKEELKKNYCIVDKGYNSFPANIPWTLYNKAASARKRLNQILTGLISERREKRLDTKNLLSCLMNYRDDSGQNLTDNQIADNIVGVLFAAQDTTASALTWILKFLHGNSKLLEAVKAEQKAIQESNRDGRGSLTWSQTRNMTLTHRVILESLRMSSIISFTFREAVADVEYKGYLIPKGWKAMPLFRNIHHNSDLFSNPHKFDPSRFEVAPRPNTFMPFGSGVHACPGNKLAKLEMLILIHHLVNNFRWKVEGSQCRIQYGPFPVPQHGLPARFWQECSATKEDKSGQYSDIGGSFHPSI